MILAADVDDTVCPSTQPVESAVAKELSRVQGMGFRLVFISGSTVGDIQAQLGANLGVEHWLLGTTGTRARWYHDGHAEEIYSDELSPAVRGKVLDAFEQLVQRHGLKPETSKEDQIQDRGSQLTLSFLGRHANEAVKRAFDPDGSRRRVWVSELEPLLGADVDIHVGGTTSIDVTAKGVDKAVGLKRFCERQGWNLDELIYFGDQLRPGGNDHPVRRLAPCVEVRDTAHTLELLRGLKRLDDIKTLPVMKKEQHAD